MEEEIAIAWRYGSGFFLNLTGGESRATVPVYIGVIPIDSSFSARSIKQTLNNESRTGALRRLRSPQNSKKKTCQREKSDRPWHYIGKIKITYP
jgi:hypothetical protein